MAYNFQHTLYLLSCLLLFTSSFQSVNSVALNSGSSEKVSVGIYYQSLANSGFMSVYAPLIFKNGLISIVDLHLSPWGNSKLINNKPVCQAKHFSFIACIESKVYNDAFAEWETCYDDLKLDRTPIKECNSSGLGMELEKKYAQETAALIPPHEYTPWVVVDGKPIHTDLKNFMTYICKAYKGSSPPEACENLPSDRAKKVHKVSYRNVFQKRQKFTRTKMLLA